jgi:peptidoglycan/LPS O-acetylase OafA/YrhL
VRQTYRPDIDALRGLAVIAVVVFHAFPSALPGGFVGVDVFFVISGYLITGLVSRDIQNGTFSLLDFYSRRIRRILPALVIVLTACGIAGWWLLLAGEYATLGQHSASAALFGSNFTLLSEAGYFDQAAHTKPLLHLWSLAIEEQFYLVWPLLMWAAWRARLAVDRWTMRLAFASLVLCIMLMSNDAAMVFYHPATRGWELLVGASLVLLERGPRWDSALRSHAAIRTWMPIVGAGCIAAAMIFLSERSAFPGWLALLPVLGTAAVIAGGSAAPFNARLAATRWLVSVGLVSFPLYLWHWPLLAFARIMAGSQPPLSLRIALVIASIALAWGTFRGVEKWFRTPRQRAAKVGGLVVALGLVGAAGLTVAMQGGMPGRSSIAGFEDMSRKGRAIHPAVPCDRSFVQSAPSLIYCGRSGTTDPTFAVLGDSHAETLFAGLAAVDSEHSWLLAGHNAVPPLLDVETSVQGSAETDRQARWAKALQHVATTPSVRTVVIAFFGNAYLHIEPFAADSVIATEEGRGQLMLTSTKWPGLQRRELVYAGLSASIDKLQSSGKTVIVMLDVPELPFLPKDCVRRPGSDLFGRQQCELSSSVNQKRNLELRKLVDRLKAQHPALKVYDPTSLICGTAECSFVFGGRSLYRDSNHLSQVGAERVAADLVAFMRGGV